MSLLAPVWLWALAAIAVPVALHLISRGRTRRVRLASLRLLTADDSRRARRIRPTQPWLLALRCLMLALVALALAQPRCSAPPADPGPGLVLVDPDLLARRPAFEPAAPEAFAELDRRIAAGATLLRLEPGLPRAVPDGDLEPATGLPDAWSLVAEAHRGAAPGEPFTVLVRDRAAALYGARPVLDRPVTWLAVPEPEREEHPVHVGPGPDGKPRRLVADSRPGSIRYRTEPAGEQDPGPAPVRVAIVHDPDRTEDAAYVRTALDAAAEHAWIPVEWVDVASSSGNTVDLLFVLSAAPPGPRSLSAVADGGTAVTDGGPQHEGCPGVLLALDTAVTLRRCSPLESAVEAVAIWRDASGRAVLDAIRSPALTHYRFHGRFHPGWSDLPTHPALGEFLIGAIGGRPELPPGADRRHAGGMGAPTVVRPSSAHRDSSRLPERIAWLLAGFVLIVERLVARRVS